MRHSAFPRPRSARPRGLFRFLPVCALGLLFLTPRSEATHLVSDAPSWMAVDAVAPNTRQVAIARNNAGTVAVAWRSGTIEIWFRRFTTAGVPLEGVKFAGFSNPMTAWSSLINTGPFLTPAIAINAAGQCTVAWCDNATGSGTIQARMFDAAAAPLGPAFTVASHTDILARPQVGLAGDGSPVVSWLKRTGASGVGNWAVRARALSATGTLLGSEIVVNDTPDALTTWLSLAVRPDRSFGVGYDHRVYISGLTVGRPYLRVFDVNGTPLGASVEAMPDLGGVSLSTNASGRFFLLSQKATGVALTQIVQGRVFNADGTPRTGVFPTPSSGPVEDLRWPTGVMAPDGSLAVFWSRANNGYTMFGRPFSADGAPQSVDFAVPGSGGAQTLIGATSPDGRMSLVWEVATGGGLSAYTSHVHLESGPSLTLTEGAVAGGPLFGSGSAVLAFHTVAGQAVSRSVRLTNVGDQSFPLTGLTMPAGFSLRGPGGIDPPATLLPGVSAPLEIVFHAAAAGVSSGTLKGEHAGVTLMEIGVEGVARLTPHPGPTSVIKRTASGGTPTALDVAVTTGQASLIKWTDSQSQWFDAQGVALGVPFAAPGGNWLGRMGDGRPLVNFSAAVKVITLAGTTADPGYPVPNSLLENRTPISAAGNAAGHLAVIWSTAGGNLRLRVFDPSGTPLAPPITVAPAFIPNVSSPLVKVDGSGRALVTWKTNLGEGPYARVFNGDGTPFTAQITLDPEAVSVASVPGMAASGAFLVARQATWTDGTEQAILAQRYAADGTLNGPVLNATSVTAGAQVSPGLHMDAAGRFAVSFRSLAQHFPRYSPYARWFDATGAPETPDTLLGDFLGEPGTIAPVIAQSGDGVSATAWSGTLVIWKTGVPSPPALTGGRLGGVLRLEWPAAAPGVTGFHLQRSTDGVTFSPLSDLAAAATSYDDAPAPLANPVYYRISASSAAGTSIFSAPLAVENSDDAAWRTLYFGSPDNSGLAADGADADNDGLTNFNEMVLGGDPLDVSSMRGARIFLKGAQWQLAVPRNAGVTGVTFTPYVSEELAFWTPVGGATLAKDGVEEIIWNLPPGGERDFWRVRLSRP